MFDVLSNVLRSLDWNEFARQFAALSWLGSYLWVLIGVVFAGLLVKAATAIFNAYVMRFWNRYVHPDEVAAAKAAIKKIEIQVEAERREVEAFRSDTNKLLAVNDRMYQEIVFLRVENARLRRELAALHSELPL